MLAKPNKKEQLLGPLARKVYRGRESLRMGSLSLTCLQQLGSWVPCTWTSALGFNTRRIEYS